MVRLDRILLVRLQKGDKKAFEEIYLMLKEPALRFCIMLLKDEQESKNLVQDAFIKIWTKRASINPDLNFTSYLFTSIKNSAFDYFKLLKRNEVLKENYKEKIKIQLIQDEEEKERRLFLVRKVIENLSPGRKKIIKLNFEEGKSYEEIAEELNISKNTVKNQLVKAKQIIREQLKIASILSTFPFLIITL